MKPVLITAGATRNPVDSMRYISAHATGRTGSTLATRLVNHTHVTALCSPLALCHMPNNITTDVFESTADLMQKMKAWIQKNPDSVIIHSAAVGDYEVQQAATQTKIPSGQGAITITLKPTPKILDHIQEWSANATVISFKAAAPSITGHALQELAKNQLLRSRSRLVFANTIGSIGRKVLLVTENDTHTYQAREQAIEALVNQVLTYIAEA